MRRENLEKKTVAELREMAKRKGLTGYSGLRKAALVELLSGAAPKAGRAATKRGASAARTRPRAKGDAAGPAARGSSKRVRGSRPKKDEAPTGGTALSPRVLRAFSGIGSGSRRGRRTEEQRIKASKYYLGVEESPELDEAFSYPETYGESTIALLVKDPYWLFAYWQFEPDIRSSIAVAVEPWEVDDCRLVLRVYDVTGSDPDDPSGYHDIDVAPGARDWYINVMRVEREYCVDIGLLRPDGSFVVIARSNRVSLPPVGPSDAVDEEWVTLEALAELYEHTAGGGPSSGSGGWGPGGGRT